MRLIYWCAAANAMFSESPEVRDAIHLLTPRAVNEGSRGCWREMEWYDNYLNMGKKTDRANLRRGTKRRSGKCGEKALGSIAKSGRLQLLKCCRPANARLNGLIYAATPAAILSVHANRCFGYHRASVYDWSWYAVRPLMAVPRH